MTTSPPKPPNADSALADALQDVDEGLRALPPIEPSGQLVRRTLDAVEARRRGGWLKVKLTMAAVAAAIVVGFVGMYAFSESPSTDGTGPEASPTDGAVSANRYTLGRPGPLDGAGVKMGESDERLNGLFQYRGEDEAQPAYSAYSWSYETRFKLPPRTKGDDLDVDGAIVTLDKLGSSNGQRGLDANRWELNRRTISGEETEAGKGRPSNGDFGRPKFGPDTGVRDKGKVQNEAVASTNSEHRAWNPQKKREVLSKEVVVKRAPNTVTLSDKKRLVLKPRTQRVSDETPEVAQPVVADPTVAPIVTNKVAGVEKSVEALKQQVFRSKQRLSLLSGKVLQEAKEKGKDKDQGEGESKDRGGDYFEDTDGEPEPEPVEEGEVAIASSSDAAAPVGRKDSGKIGVGNFHARVLSQNSEKKELKTPKPKIFAMNLPADTNGQMPALNDQSPDETGLAFESVVTGGKNRLDVDGLRAAEQSKIAEDVSALRGYLDTTIIKLKFLSSQGYFQNTYVPGDPSLAWLERSLAGGVLRDGRRLELASAAAAYKQPFDAPTHSALGLAISADRTAVDGPTRMTIQVGLKGSIRQAAQRAPLNATLVVDLREVPSEEARRTLWTLADAMAQDQRSSDRFSLVVAGLATPVIMEGKRFDAAAVRAALAQALETRETGASQTTMQQALAAAYAVSRRQSASDAPLGANLVVLATANRLGNVQSLERQVHAAAVAGTSLTTVGVGASTNGRELSRLALSGQGRRRLVAATEQARSTIKDELAAAGRVVARAARIRIRLHPGVKLVSVLGSKKLDAPASARVKEAEKAADIRIATTTGITADRGEDEAGIQIVIPAFYAADSHVILLDVVVPGPGPIADARVRYKDLVRMDNGVETVQLALSNNTNKATPLTDNVQKNRAAHWISAALSEAATMVRSSDYDGAVRQLEASRATIGALQSQSARLGADPELARDAAMLDEYVTLLKDHPQWAQTPGIPQHLSRSLELAGKRK